MYESLAIVAVFAFIYSAIAGRIERSVISGPIVEAFPDSVAFRLLAGPDFDGAFGSLFDRSRDFDQVVKAG